MSGVPAGWWALVPVATLILGYVGTLITEAKRDARAAEREREMHEKAQEALRHERRVEFELDVLRRTHDALSQLSRASGRAHFADMMAAKQSGKYGSHQLGGDIDAELMEGNRALNAVVGLILDDDVRAIVGEAHTALNIPSARIEGDIGEAERDFARAVSLVVMAHDAIGERVRELYA